jgi:hypothetical protein
MGEGTDTDILKLGSLSALHPSEINECSKVGCVPDQVRRFGREDKLFLLLFYNKTNQMHNFSNLFWKETPHVSDSPSVHNREFFTVHTAVV